MTHVRQQIREAAATALDGNTAAYDEIFSSLVFPADSSRLPLIHVHVDTEESEQASLGGLLTRIASLRVTAIADESDERDIDNALDSLAAEIETALGGNTFSGIAKQTVLTGTDIQRSAEGNRATAAITLNYAVVYHTDDSDGEVAL